MNLRSLLLISVILLPVSNVMAEKFAADTRQDFLKSCVSNCVNTVLVPGKRDLCAMFCDCSLEGLENEYSEKQVVDGFAAGFPTSPQFKQETDVIFTRCSNEAMSAFGYQ